RPPHEARPQGRHHGADEPQGCRRREGPRRQADPALREAAMKPLAWMAAFAVAPALALADGAALVQEKCAACHALAPGYAAGDVAERAQRKGPPLDYAGNKFREA